MQWDVSGRDLQAFPARLSSGEVNCVRLVPFVTMTVRYHHGPRATSHQLMDAIMRTISHQDWLPETQAVLLAVSSAPAASQM